MDTTYKKGSRRPTETVMLGIKVDLEFKHQLEAHAASIDSDMSKLGRAILSEGLEQSKAAIGQRLRRADS
jgi:hypothetical protein|tara:strand:- start:931 stop:1140 length:210 start_codon:yes stop_codon:yes gene_type:complete